MDAKKEPLYIFFPVSPEETKRLAKPNVSQGQIKMGRKRDQIARAGSIRADCARPFRRFPLAANEPIPVRAPFPFERANRACGTRRSLVVQKARE